MGLMEIEDQQPHQDRHRMESPDGSERRPLAGRVFLASRGREKAEIARRRRRHTSPRRGQAGGRRHGGGRSRSPCESRSSPRKERSPRKDEDATEEITTLFVTSLPNDAREDEVRA